MARTVIGLEERAIRRKLKDCLYFAAWRCRVRDWGRPRLTVPGLVKMWKKQQGRCPLSGVKLAYTGPYGAVLDRKNPKRRYQRDNVWIVSKRANAAKGDMTMREFRRLCRQVLKLP